VSGGRRQARPAPERRGTDYHRMSIGQKQAYQRSRMREPAVACPKCETQLMPADLLAHFEQRCTGPREPGPKSRWISWRAALDLDVVAETLEGWLRRGMVRSRGDGLDRELLEQDVVLLVAWARTLEGVPPIPHPPGGLGTSGAGRRHG
jgi:hypothetical protein